MLKRILCILLALACLLACALAEETLDGFVFMDAIDWNSSANEAAAVLGKVQRKTEHDPEIGWLEVVLANDVEIYGVSGAQVLLLFYNDSLMEISCLFPETEVRDVQALIYIASEELGIARIYEKDNYLMDFMMGANTLCDWKLGEVTRAVLTRESKTEGNYVLYITNEEIGDAFSEKVLKEQEQEE